MVTTAETLQLLSSCKPELQRRFHVIDLAVFGSVARGEARPDSDIDLLVDFDGPATFKGYMGTRFFLEDLLGREVDLVMKGAMRPEIWPYVEKDLIHVS